MEEKKDLRTLHEIEKQSLDGLKQDSVDYWDDIFGSEKPSMTLQQMKDRNRGNINSLIYANKQRELLDTNEISDGYHTFGELYEHRIQLFIALARLYDELIAAKPDIVWRSHLHSDGSSFEGYFILGIDRGAGRQITYHLPMSKWEECYFAYTMDAAPEFDGHTSADVLERLKNL